MNLLSPGNFACSGSTAGAIDPLSNYQSTSLPPRTVRVPPRVWRKVGENDRIRIMKLSYIVCLSLKNLCNWLS